MRTGGLGEGIIEMFHGFVLLAIASTAAAIAAFEEGETRTATGHATARATHYAADNRQDN